MPIQTIDAPTLKRWLDSGEAVLIDVREPGEHASCHIAGATLLPVGSVCKSALPKAYEGKKLVVHCLKGGRGSTACEKLLAEDSALTLYNLEGGIGAWQAAGFDVACTGKKHLPLDRQVQLTIGVMLFTASLLGYLLSPAWFALTGLIGIGLMVAGLTGFCGLARIMAKMPWNQ